MRSRRFGTSFYLLAVMNLVVAVSWFVMFSWARSAAATFDTESGNLAAENSKEAYLSMATKDLHATEDDRKYIDSLFVPEGSEVNLLERVEDLGKHSGVEVKIVKFTPEGDTLDLAFSTNGSFEDTYYFLRMVEVLPFALSVNSFSLSSVAGDKKSVVWQGNYDLTLTSYLPQPKS